MNTFTAICGHSAPVVGAPWSVGRAMCDVTPCPACLEQIEDGDHAPFALIAKRLADKDDLIRQLSERVATCSELLGRAAERHDNAERLRAEVASVLEMLDNLASVWGDEGVFRRCRDRLRKIAVEPIHDPAPLTPEEAQAAYDAAPDVPLSKERIEEIVRYATGKRPDPAPGVTP